jgi:hypothetical protein
MQLILVVAAVALVEMAAQAELIFLVAAVALAHMLAMVVAEPKAQHGQMLLAAAAEQAFLVMD